MTTTIQGGGEDRAEKFLRSLDEYIESTVTDLLGSYGLVRREKSDDPEEDSTPAPPEPGNKMKEHAEFALIQAGEPKVYRDLLARMGRNGFVSFGKTPWDSLSALPNHYPDTFSRPARGLLGLSAWDDQDRAA
jgi:hypothetical protein